MIPGLAQEIVDFWLDAGPQLWFAKDEAFDARIAARFEAAHQAAARGEFADWESQWQGSLALLLLLDQFPRNIYRGSGHSFATDPLARRIAQDAIALGHDRAAPETLRSFYYLPFEHSELLADQDRSIALFEAMGERGADLLHWARLHRDIIVRFGRFPHRNAALGRSTSAEEQAFLDAGGFHG